MTRHYPHKKALSPTAALLFARPCHKLLDKKVRLLTHDVKVSTANVLLRSKMPYKTVDVALLSYRSGQHNSRQQAAKNNEVARSTLQDRNNGRLPWNEAFQHRQAVLPGDERALAGSVRTQTIAGYPIDKPTLYRLANSILYRRAEAGERGVRTALGKHWHQNFYTRFPRFEDRADESSRTVTIAFCIGKICTMK